MFFTLTYTEHLLLSIFLHICGISFGLFWWRLFPKNPVRYITKLPNEISLMVENVNEEAEYAAQQEKLLIYEKKIKPQRNFG
ncbi:unnamed protein product [Cylicocyclus nassatus]|uniref:Uncharacterized protein n=1 Tax=Cylicocyclus nassatus TaxID=53992 RepID=A0AA36H996_CYLNA|nr:unnamed protein product [Cylicocyclus nassatus]